MDPSVTLFGPVDTFLAPVLIYLLLVLAVLNMAGRAIEYKQLKRQAEAGADALARHPLRVGTNFLLVVGGFYLLTVERHAGIIISLFAVTLVLADLFEFESRKVEVRQDWDLESPKGSIGASVIMLLYIVYQVFDRVFPFWEPLF